MLRAYHKLLVITIAKLCYTYNITINKVKKYYTKEVD